VYAVRAATSKFPAKGVAFRKSEYKVRSKSGIIVAIPIIGDDKKPATIEKITQIIAKITAVLKLILFDGSKRSG
jgi:hypothetical protein